VYRLLDQAEAVAMGPLQAVTLRDLATRQGPAPSQPAVEIRNPAPAPPVAGTGPA
jgi:hypothetical protein